MSDGYSSESSGGMNTNSSVTYSPKSNSFLVSL